MNLISVHDLSSFISKSAVAESNFWVASRVSFIFDIWAALVYESRRANPVFTTLIQMFAAHCYTSLLPLLFSSSFCPIMMVITFLFCLFVLFFLAQKKEACNVVYSWIICRSYLSLFSVLACPKYLHRSAQNMQIFAPKCTPELIQASRDSGAVLKRLKRAWFWIDSLVRWTIGSMLRRDKEEDR